MSELKNVIVVYDSGYVNGGAAKVAINTAVSLSEETNLNICYFCATGPVCPQLLDSKVKCTCLNIPDINHRKKIDTFFSGIFNKHVYKAFKNYLWNFSNQNTILHIHGWSHSLSSSILKASNDLKFKRVITLHDYFVCCPNGGFLNYRKMEICHRKPLSPQCVFCNCDKRNYIQKVWRVLRQRRQNRYLSEKENFIYLSELSKSVIEKSYPKAHYYYYPNSIDRFSYHSNGLEGKDSFLYLGRLSEEKGIRLFCEAITKASAKGIVIGDGELREELEKKYTNIEFLGWMNKAQIEQVLPRVKALIFPSLWYEVSPLTVPEMLSAGIPCIVSDCCAAKDNIVPEENGYLFQAGSSENLASVIKNFYVNDFSYKRQSDSIEVLTDIYSLLIR